MNVLSEEEQVASFNNVQSVLANDERFKVKLGIGSDAFASLKTGNLVAQLWGLGCTVGTGAGVAASGTLASTLFGTFWTTIGVATAATPIGWVVGAAVASGGVYYGVSRLFKSYSGSRVDEIPKFLNTPLDVLATSTLDLLGTLALKVASMDGNIDRTERASMQEYFVEEWGYDPLYLEHALDVLEQNIDKSRLSDMTASLAEFASSNPDCNFSAIQAEIRKLLVEIAQADGHLDEREEMAIERIENALREHGSVLHSVSQAISGAAAGVTAASGAVGKSATKAISSTTSSMREMAGKLWAKK
ncbi:Tellurite resistance protein TerB [Roseovarius gaetbuli]|uniref:Tellurite resistance protein TerB n=1 Tax=Roseovarius gaetbuli TaxID=1356575 RepID=A0A1X6ZQM3_9RHOB|nr:TerB family tellurite resistance protein [Roseovarius gaetbuli]SLN58850.1 Tellurite resistance protein TerB [Roseovarius gaetbuli]